MLPDAPRTPSSVYPSTWDWSLLDNNSAVEYNKKSKRRTFKSSENVSNYNNTEKGTHYGGMKQSSTHEYISDMTGFNDPITKSKSNEHIARNQVRFACSNAMEWKCINIILLRFVMKICMNLPFLYFRMQTQMNIKRSHLLMIT